MACDCNEHSRATLLRQAAAQAGSGLPAIDPRMPMPAGTGLDRRSFLLRSGAAMLSVYGASKLGFSQLEAGIARAQSEGPAPVLVSVFLDGGADSLSILAPTGHTRYPQLRPNLALSQAETLGFAEDPSLRWHPRAANLRTLHEEGKVTVMPAIGYTDADQSHFTSRHYWEVGALNPNGNTGWLGRFIDLIGADDNPLQGLSLDGWLSPALATSTKPVASVDGPDYDLWTPGVWEDEISSLMYTTARDVGDLHAAASDAGRKTAGRVAGQAMRVRERLDSLDIGDPPASYPDEYFGRNLAALAAMLDAGLPIRCAALSAAGGYDTHDNQQGSLGDDLGATFDSIFAFQRDLEQRGIADQVVTLVWSEFGRRPEENGTGAAAGTDHGAAGTAFLVGSQAKGQLVGEFPGLTTLDEDDNLRHTVDFRAVYCGLLEQWFDQDLNDTLIPGQASFARPTLIK